MIFDLTLITSYHLARHIGINKLFSVLAAILYLANPYSIFYEWRILNASIMFYAVLPLIFLSLSKISRDENFKKYFFVLLFGEFLILPSFTNPVMYISLIFFTVVLSLSYSFIRYSSNHSTIRKTILRYVMLSSVFFLPISGFFTSTLKTLPYPLNTFRLADFKAQAIVYNLSSAHMNLSSLFSLTGLPPLYEQPIWFNFEYIYLSDISKVAGLAVAIVIIGFFVISGINKKIDKGIYPFLILFVIILILWSSIGSILLQSFPVLFLPFRDPYQKLGPGFTLVLIILFCYSAYKLFEMKITKKYKFVKVFLGLAIIFPTVYWASPFISGNFIPTAVKPDKLLTFSAFTDAPYRYMPAINYLKQDKDVANGNVRVLVYPFTGFTWCEKDLFWGNDILRFSGITTVSTTEQVTFKDETTFYRNLSDPVFLENPNYLNIITKLGIKYILIQKHPCDVNFVNVYKKVLVQMSNALQNTSKYLEERMSKMPLEKVMETSDYSLFKISHGVPTSISLIGPSENSTVNKGISFFDGPTINDTNLRTQLIFKGLQFPTSMAFLGPNDILVLEKNNGTVHRIVDGKELPQPLLRVDVANKGDRGMLGIAVARNQTKHDTNVFLYYTESGGGKNGDDQTLSPGVEPVGNSLYRYELVNSKLVNPQLFFSIPPNPASPYNNGGKVVIGPDQNVYFVVGDLGKFRSQYQGNLNSSLVTKAQNFENGTAVDGSGGILRLTQDGKPVNGILGNGYPLNLYYAYGIRDSFGISFDPVTGKLWDTEDGPGFGDEINLVQAGFNSGWAKVQGIWENKGISAARLGLDTHNLVDFGGKGKYRSPELTWNHTGGLTAVAFINSTKLGKKYQNDTFVGDFVNGYLYHFKLNEKRTGLVLNGSVADKVVKSPGEPRGAIFGRGFSGITDIKVGPDGYLYVLSVQKEHNNEGSIFRIVPREIVEPQYQKVSSSEYIVNLKDISQPAYIVLAQSYEDGWKAFVNGKDQIPDKDHFIVGGFANGWNLNKTGDFNVKLYYKPERYYEIGLIIGFLLICPCLFYFVYNDRKRFKDTLGRLIRAGGHRADR